MLPGANPTTRMALGTHAQKPCHSHHAAMPVNSGCCSDVCSLRCGQPTAQRKRKVPEHQDLCRHCHGERSKPPGRFGPASPRFGPWKRLIQTQPRCGSFGHDDQRTGGLWLIKIFPNLFGGKMRELYERVPKMARMENCYRTVGDGLPTTCTAKSLGQIGISCQSQNVEMRPGQRMRPPCSTN